LHLGVWRAKVAAERRGKELEELLIELSGACFNFR
jgi:hypothetical protein